MPVYRARVTRVGPSGVHVVIPDIGGTKYEFGPLKATGTPFAVGQECIVGGVGDVRDDVVLLAGQAGVTMALDDLSDVTITAPVDGESLVRDGGEWVNQLLTYELEDLTDVDLTAPAPGESFVYNGSQWSNTLLQYDLDDLTDVAISSPAEGHVLQRGGSVWANSATLDMIGSAAGTDSITTKVTGDSQKRFIANADGKLEWGSGSATQDTNLYRGAADLLQTDDIFRAYRSAASDVALAATVSSDAHNRYSVQADGKTEWGSGSATRDTNLYRSAADTLKTDDALIVTGALTAATGAFGGTSGDAVYIGNDGKLVDVNVADRIGVQGQSSAANGGFIFGSGGDTNLYRSAANTLKTDDTFIAANIIAGDTGWTTPTLAGSWVNFGGTHQTARYRKHITGVVEIQGCVKSGSGTIFTLNSGYRPGSILIFACIGDNVEARVDVNPDGTVVLAVGSSGFLSINMSFYVG